MMEPFRVSCGNCRQYIANVVDELIGSPLTGEMFVPRTAPYMPLLLPFEAHHGIENLRCPICRRNFTVKGQKLLDMDGQEWFPASIANPKWRELGHPPRLGRPPKEATETA